MSDNYDVSVVIPTYNSAATICRAIDSVLSQTVKPFEIIVVDDGSTDDTQDVLGKYGNKICYIRQSNSSCAGGRNTGIKKANGNWIAFLDADDEWLPEKLEKQLEILKYVPTLMWCGSNAYNAVGENKSFRCDPERAKRNLDVCNCYRDYLVAVRDKCFYECSITMLINRNVFDEVGLFSENLLRSEDTDMWTRIAFKYPVFGFVTEPLAIVHLDITVPELEELRIKAKSGVYFRKMIKRNLTLSQEYGRYGIYKDYASRLVLFSLKHTIFYGYKSHARETIKEFKELVPFYWRFMAYLLTVNTTFTVWVLRKIMFLRYKLGFERTVTRRWIRDGKSQE